MHHELDIIHEQFNHIEIRGQIMTRHMDEECRGQKALRHSRSYFLQCRYKRPMWPLES